MALTDLVPWGRNHPANPQQFVEGGDSFLALHREMNRMLDNFARSFGMSMPAQFGTWPHIEVSETDKEVKVVAELPGLEEKDVDVSLHEGLLTLKGEKKAESGDGKLYTERWHGQFQRSLQVGPDVDPDKVNAAFKNGVLTVTLAKRPDAQQRVKRIPISTG